MSATGPPKKGSTIKDTTRKTRLMMASVLVRATEAFMSDGIVRRREGRAVAQG